MKYNWTENDFLKQIDLLRTLIKNESDYERKLYLQKVLDSSEYLAYENIGQIEKPNEEIKQRLHSINSERLSYGRYYSIIQNFYFSLASLNDKINKIETLIESLFGENFDIATITGAFITNNQALSITSKFYSTFDDELLPYFNEAFNDRYHTLRFNGRITGPTTTKTSDGTTAFIDGVRKNFINICRTRSATKIFTLIHEYGHATKNLLNPERAYSNDDGLFEEVDGIFPELVALEENISNLDPLFISFLKYTNLITYYNNANSLLLHTVILNSWKDNNYRFNRALKKQLKYEYDINNEILELALNTTIFDEGTYILSYLVAIELLHIYKKDKHLALKLYKEFLKLPADKEVLPFIYKLVTLNGNIFEEATIIVDEMKLQLERYGAKHVYMGY